MTKADATGNDTIEAGESDDTILAGAAEDTLATGVTDAELEVAAEDPGVDAPVVDAPQAEPTPIRDERMDSIDPTTGTYTAEAQELRRLAAQP
jgi:Ca2+-binding RTX toxin-like protein